MNYLDGCENKNCDFYSTCESDGITEGRCICPENCDGDKVITVFRPPRVIKPGALKFLWICLFNGF